MGASFAVIGSEARKADKERAWAVEYGERVSG